MFKIGDFSKLSRVSVKTLRYYDELGMLKPAHVDHFTITTFRRGSPGAFALGGQAQRRWALPLL
jgi:MerR family regulatory protein